MKGDDSELTEEELAGYGEDLLDQYMDILSDPEMFVVEAPCVKCGKAGLDSSTLVTDIPILTCHCRFNNNSL